MRGQKRQTRGHHVSSNRLRHARARMRTHNTRAHTRACAHARTRHTPRVTRRAHAGDHYCFNEAGLLEADMVDVKGCGTHAHVASKKLSHTGAPHLPRGRPPPAMLPTATWPPPGYAGLPPWRPAAGSSRTALSVAAALVATAQHRVLRRLQKGLGRREQPRCASLQLQTPQGLRDVSEAVCGAAERRISDASDTRTPPPQASSARPTRYASWRCSGLCSAFASWRARGPRVLTIQGGGGPAFSTCKSSQHGQRICFESRPRVKRVDSSRCDPPLQLDAPTGAAWFS